MLRLKKGALSVRPWSSRVLSSGHVFGRFPVDVATGNAPANSRRNPTVADRQPICLTALHAGSATDPLPTPSAPRITPRICTVSDTRLSRSTHRDSSLNTAGDNPPHRKSPRGRPSYLCVDVSSVGGTSGPSVDRAGSLSLGRSTTPVIAGHDSAHELIEQRHGKCRVSVIWTPDHPLGNELIARRAQRSDIPLQTRRNVA